MLFLLGCGLIVDGALLAGDALTWIPGEEVTCELDCDGEDVRIRVAPMPDDVDDLPEWCEEMGNATGYDGCTYVSDDCPS